ncbi:MAG: hypothetical protein QM650_08610 [Microlunatus sp.]
MSEIRDELHQLINSLPEEQVKQVLADVRRRGELRAVPSEHAFAWVGSFSGPSDLSTNPGHLDGFGRD